MKTATNEMMDIEVVTFDLIPGANLAISLNNLTPDGYRLVSLRIKSQKAKATFRREVK